MTGTHECAATQIWQTQASTWLEWWCATISAADQIVSRRQKQAIHFEADRMRLHRDSVF
jgi:hypothetical protein